MIIHNLNHSPLLESSSLSFSSAAIFLPSNIAVAVSTWEVADRAIPGLRGVATRWRAVDSKWRAVVAWRRSLVAW